ncbi:MAG: hypothetical protein ABR586_00900 [Thermoplasmatota archaeon]
MGAYSIIDTLATRRTPTFSTLLGLALDALFVSLLVFSQRAIR